MQAPACQWPRRAARPSPRKKTVANKKKKAKKRKGHQVDSAQDRRDWQRWNDDHRRMRVAEHSLEQKKEECQPFPGPLPFSRPLSLAAARVQSFSKARPAPSDCAGSLEDCSWEVGDNCDPLSPLKPPVGLVRGLRSNRCYCWVCLFQGFFQHLPAVVDHIVDTMVKHGVKFSPFTTLCPSQVEGDMKGKSHGIRSHAFCYSIPGKQECPCLDEG